MVTVAEGAVSDPLLHPVYGLRALLAPRALSRLAVIGALVLAVILCFAWAAGCLAPHRLTQARIIDTFETVNGPHPGFRRNHAKGLCLTGYFDGNGRVAKLSRASVFAAGRVAVTGRFALAGGMPRAADSPAAVRSMALRFVLRDGQEWRTGMNDIPVFAVNSAQGFRDQLVAMKPDKRTGKPDPAAVKDFFRAYPQSARAAKLIKAAPLSSGSADARYNSLNAFLLAGPDGATPVRWSMVPEDRFQPAPAAAPKDRDYLFDALVARLHQGPVHWRLVLTLADPRDPTSDATLAWPADRRTIDAGRLTVTAVQIERAGNCRDINFDPLVLPDGIAPSDDPLLSARSAAYSVSFTRRAGETKMPSAVQAGDAP